MEEEELRKLLEEKGVKIKEISGDKIVIDAGVTVELFEEILRKIGRIVGYKVAGDKVIIFKSKEAMETEKRDIAEIFERLGIRKI